jgi:hypothetical protein
VFSTSAFTGWSPRSWSSDCTETEPAVGSYVTENTWPSAPGVLVLKPRYEIHAWFGFVGST